MTLPSDVSCILRYLPVELDRRLCDDPVTRDNRGLDVDESSKRLTKSKLVSIWKLLKSSRTVWELEHRSCHRQLALFAYVPVKERGE